MQLAKGEFDVTLNPETLSDTAAASALSVSVVPDSCTGELEGLSGKLAIRIAEGKHFYEFAYVFGSLDASPESAPPGKPA